MQVFELFVRDAQFHPAQRIWLDQVHEFPTNGPLWQAAL
jgi:hypothetical protein